jgi:hypothetical protein
VAQPKQAALQSIEYPTSKKAGGQLCMAFLAQHQPATQPRQATIATLLALPAAASPGTDSSQGPSLPARPRYEHETDRESEKTAGKIASASCERYTQMHCCWSCTRAYQTPPLV